MPKSLQHEVCIWKRSDYGEKGKGFFGDKMSSGGDVGWESTGKGLSGRPIGVRERDSGPQKQWWWKYTLVLSLAHLPRSTSRYLGRQTHMLFHFHLSQKDEFRLTPWKIMLCADIWNQVPEGFNFCFATREVKFKCPKKAVHALVDSIEL